MKNFLKKKVEKFKTTMFGFTLIELMAVIIIISLIIGLTFPNIINRIKTTKDSNNKMIEDIIISSVKKYVNDNARTIGIDENCISIKTLIDHDYLKEGIIANSDIADTKVIQLTYEDDFHYELVNKKDCIVPATQYLLTKTNPSEVTEYNSGDVHEMYIFVHEKTEQTPSLIDYRYIGNDPYNYIYFNNELWRIIGIFTVEDENGKLEQKLKLVRNDVLNDVVWDTNRSNDWVNSTLNNYLNNDYYNTLSVEDKKMIATTKVYLGGFTDSLNFNAETFYSYERGNSVYSGRQINTIENISLIYPSDYIYTYALGINNTCYNDAKNCNQSLDSWLGFDYNKVYIQQWTVTPYYSTQWRAYQLTYNGAVHQNHTNNKFSYRPTIYLSSKVKIKSGDGSKDNAYKIFI